MRTSALGIAERVRVHYVRMPNQINQNPHATASINPLMH